MLAAQLNELGVHQEPSQQRPSRQNGKAGPQQPLPQSSSSILDAADSDSEPEDLVRNDGTLLASEPPKPL